MGCSIKIFGKSYDLTMSSRELEGCIEVSAFAQSEIRNRQVRIKVLRCVEETLRKAVKNEIVRARTGNIWED